MKIKEGFVVREVAGKIVAVATGEASIGFNGMITLNPTGKFLWEKLENDISKEELINAVMEEYNVEYDLAKKDIEAFVLKLKSEGILCE